MLHKGFLSVWNNASGGITCNFYDQQSTLSCSSALLSGSPPVVVEGVAHHPLLLEPSGINQIGMKKIGSKYPRKKGPG